MTLQQIIDRVLDNNMDKLSDAEILRAQQHFTVLTNLLEYHERLQEDFFYKMQNAVIDIASELKNRFETNFSLSKI